MLITETHFAGMLGFVTLAFLAGFWFLPGGVLALRRRAHGEIQVDLRPGYRPETLYRLLDLYGPDGVRSFRRMLLADMIFPAVYGALLFVLAGLLHRARPGPIVATDALRVAGVTAAAFDYAENIFLLIVLRHLPRRQWSVARCAGACTTMKNGSMLVALAALAAAAAILR